MQKTQTSLLLELAKKLKKEKPNKDKAIKSLRSAGIVTDDGKITKNFPNLDCILSIAK
jgi:predicted transcriptional regulator